MIELANIPEKPGVYLYRNNEKKIIYVGKAINLKKRVSQYFQKDNALGSKTQQLVSQIHSIETKIVDSEIAALILEASLIKKHHPKYNSLLKDDCSYIYICITKEKLPRVFSTHKSKINQEAIFYGPFPNSQAVKSLLKTIRKIFPYISVKHHPKKECLYCHLKLCPGSCPDPIIYRQNINNIKKILSGKLKKLDQQLKKGMKKASLDEDYNLALNLRNQLTSLEYITSGWQHLSNLYEKVNIPEDEKLAANNELKLILKPFFPQIKNINRIECFDISNLGSKYFVGSMAVFQNSIFDKNEYRKFKIKTKATQDDQYMIKEVIWRRFNHPEWSYPNLIIVDGGKPQVSAVSALNLKNICLIGLAKKEETIVIKNSDEWQEIKLPLRSNALKLLQQLRNEAHRFANQYRKELIKKSLNLK